METRRMSDDYSRIGEELIAEYDEFEHIRDSTATIAFLASDHAKRRGGRPVLGECEKVQPKNKWAIPADFLVVIYEPNCEGMGEELIRRVLYHELLHVGISRDGSGRETYGVRPHDLEDFRLCVERWGLDWEVA